MAEESFFDDTVLYLYSIHSKSCDYFLLYLLCELIMNVLLTMNLLLNVESTRTRQLSMLVTLNTEQFHRLLSYRNISVTCQMFVKVIQLQLAFFPSFY